MLRYALRGAALLGGSVAILLLLLTFGDEEWGDRFIVTVAFAILLGAAAGIVVYVVRSRCAGQ